MLGFTVTENSTSLREQLSTLVHREARPKSRIWICPDCGKLYLSIFAHSRQGLECGCGHLFDQKDAS